MSRLVRRGYIGNSYIVRNKVYKVYGPIFSENLPPYRYYQCFDEFCAEIHHKDCKRSCHGALFNTGDKRTILLNKETISVIKCQQGSGYENTIMACTEIDYPNSTTVIGKDCINGKRLENQPTKQLDMMSLRRILNESKQFVPEIPRYEDLLLYPNVTYATQISSSRALLIYSRSSISYLTLYLDPSGPGRTLSSPLKLLEALLTLLGPFWNPTGILLGPYGPFKTQIIDPSL